MGHLDDGFVLRVRLLAEPCLWYWEIRDAVDGRVVESSWASEWTAFASRAEAATAGTSRLAELATTVSTEYAGASSHRSTAHVVPEVAGRAG